jgi:hypothetical protein
MAQRVVLAQEQLKLAQTNPEMHNLYEAYRRMYTALGIQNIDDILKPPAQPQAENPAVENGRIPLIASGAPANPVQAFPDQDHDAHIAAHMAFAQSRIVKTSMPIYAVLVQHVYEHLALKAEAAARQQLGMPPMQPPTPEQPMDQTSADPALQATVAKLIAQYLTEFNKMEEQLFGTGMDSEDPLIKLKSRELDIRQANDERKMAEERAQRAQQARMEAAKLRQQERLNEERIQSSEDMAKLRASIDVTKMFMPKPGGGVPGN